MYDSHIPKHGFYETQHSTKPHTKPEKLVYPFQFWITINDIPATLQHHC